MIAFADALPGLRQTVQKDMSAPGMGRTKILATVVNLLETTMIRVGNGNYAKENKSYGLTTLLNRHVEGRWQRAEIPIQGQKRQGVASQRPRSESASRLRIQRTILTAAAMRGGFGAAFSISHD